MKKIFSCILVLSVLILSQSCKKDSDNKDDSNVLGGDPSSMGVVGTHVSSTTIAVEGVSDLDATVISLADGISSYDGSCTVTNATIKNILSNIPGITINGDNVTATGFKFKSTTEGVESYVGLAPGILVKYSSAAGDTYPVGSTGRTRTVTHVSTTNDYDYGIYMIKVIKVEEPTSSLKSMGVNKITYWANHRFGLVGIQFDLTDGTTANFPVYTSAENK
jgi:hypothetical protein